MKKLIIATAVLALLCSCQKSIIDKEGLYQNGIVAFQSNSTGELAAFLEEDGPITFTLASSTKLDKDVTVNFEPVRDQAVLEAFNKAQGTGYWLLPEENYTLDKHSAVIKAGNAVSEPVSMQVSIDGFKNGVIYCLPLKITGTSSSMTAIPGQEYAYVVIRGYVYASAANLPGGSYFEMPSTVSDPALSLEVCTMEIRVKANSWASANPYISSLIGVEENFLLRFGDISCDPNQLQLAGQGVSITSKAHFDTGKWYHIAVVADGIKQTCDLYINGELDSSTPMGGKGINLGKVYNSKFAIGMSEKGRYLNGQVSEARVWGRLLTPTELMNNQCSIVDPVKEAQENKLLGYWKLDAENRGKDLTGHGYDGYAHGSVTYTEANIRCPE
ncbi:MAG: DUF1735 and LamG domain-containing protein [Candidatus Cryptobacteroides sp.]|nr:DUF1735 and LamG domain-containing protein [Candidatus Cryptobacteroides sp.]